MMMLIVYDKVKEKNIELMNLDSPNEVPRVMEYWKEKYARILNDLSVVFLHIETVPQILAHCDDDFNTEAGWREVSFDTCDFVDKV